jgi:hypothetical protein
MTIAGYTLELFDGSIDDLPERRHQEFNLALMLESGIGSDVQALQTKLTSLIRYIESGKKDEAKMIVNNLYQQVEMMKAGVFPGTLAFAALVKKINGEDVSMLSAEQIRARLDFTKIKANPMREFIDMVKKKLTLK